MHAIRCPHCGNPSMTFWSKLSLGPARKLKCRSCRKPVSVFWLHGVLHLLALGLTPVLLFLASLAVLESITIEWLRVALPAAALITGVAAEAWLYYRFVPLVARAA